MKRINLGLGRIYPKGYRESVAELLKFSGNKADSTVWLGSALVLNILVLAILFLGFNTFTQLSETWFYLLLCGAAATIILQSLFYLQPYYAAEKRASSVEAVLPSFYQLVASYLRSGMTPFQALKSASRNEFGVLKEELDIATSKALGTQSFSDALLGVCRHIKSENLQRSTELMVRGMDSGGSLAKMLEESAANLIENKSLKRQIIAATRTYTLMVIFAVVMGAPLLLSISTRFNERLLDLSSNIEEGATQIPGFQLGLLGGDMSINPSTLFNIALFMIFMTSLISSFLVGIIVDGKEKFGLKYAALFVPASIGLFYVFKEVLRTFF